MAASLVGIGKKLKRAGLKVKAVDGWRTRSRGYTFTPMRVMFHHTASSRRGGNAPSLGICTRGRSDLPGPLCHLMIGRDGTVYLVAAGYANHAGYGGPERGIPKDSGNRYAVGIEVENDGVGEPWSRELLRACDITFAVLLEHLDEGAGALLGHKEYTSRKIDPHPIDMDKDRDRVRELLRDKEPRRRPPRRRRKRR
jgi:hypothetical protein